MARLEWRGDAVKAKVVRAAKLGVDATMQAAVMAAKMNHGPGAHSQQRFESQSGEAERSIRVTKSARRTSGGIAGEWGSKGVVYFRRLELGFQGKDSAGRIVDAPAYPSLRPAAQTQYPNLASRIRRAFGA